VPKTKVAREYFSYIPNSPFQSLKVKADAANLISQYFYKLN
jgi:hypothetical protein